MDNHRQKYWHSENISETYKNLNTQENGLSTNEAQIRLEKNGPNELEGQAPKTILQMLKEQLWDPMIFILLGASGFSAILKEWPEAIVILLIVILNAIIGIVQEKRAQTSLAALRKMGAPKANVIRDGQTKIIPAKELVVGDIVSLHDGDMVPADLRLIETANLKIQESSLTGESVPVEKDANNILANDCPIGDRVNMAFSSSIVTYGRGMGIVTATGMDTEMGAIAGMIEDEDNAETPLKKKLNSAGKVLTVVGLIICVVIFAIGIMYGRPLVPQFLVAISLAISIIPEGLPATASIVMALGVKRMAKKNALIKKLPAVETLGNATVICSDKTGTLTLNKMTVTEAAFADNLKSGKTTEAKDVKSNQLSNELALAGLLCNDASFDPEDKEKIIGDPTEGALIPFAEQFKLQLNTRSKYPRIGEQPFDSDRKMMTTVHEINNEKIAYTKGAIDELLNRCTNILTSTGIRKLTETDRKQILSLNKKMSEDALRVLGFAKRNVDDINLNSDLENNLTFIGMIGMIDPPREEVAESVQTCRDAGIRTIMITGDHKITALAIAKKLNIFKPGDLAISGQELDQMSDAELDVAVRKATVFARVSPADKLRIIKSLKRNGEVTAMTGDGVNDSPALKAADIGVAMGITGTDVAKNVSDMILLDDSFTTIATAIKEGRRVYRNIQKIIQFLLVGNIAEISTLTIATIFNWDAPLLAIHILWVNLATATLPALALGVDPASPNIMKHKPVKSGTLFEKDLVWRVITQGLFVAVLTLTAYWVGAQTDNAITGQTMAFAVLALSQMIRSFNQHSNTDPIWKRGSGFNFWLVISFAVSAFFMGLILLVPSLQEVFYVTNLSVGQWIVVIALALLSIAHVEISKGFKKIRKAKPIFG